MNTKELLKKLENKNSFWLAWSILWRIMVIQIAVYIALFIPFMILGFLIAL